jgi:hypothetical protein
MRKLLMILFILFIPMTIVGQTTEKAPVVDEMSATLLKRILETAEAFEYVVKDDRLLAVYEGEFLIHFDIYRSKVHCKSYLPDKYDNISLYAINEWNKKNNPGNAKKSEEYVYISTLIAVQKGVTIDYIITYLYTHALTTKEFKKQF